jgi:hypothetical protein
MARNTSSRAAKTTAGTKLVGGVFTSASLKRTGVVKNDYYGTLKELHLDKEGNLVAVASCGDECFVCRKDEIKQVADFLNALVDPK